MSDITILHCNFLCLHQFLNNINPTNVNFQRDINMKEEDCIQKCQKVLNKEHITWCVYLNKPNDFKY